MPSSASSLSTSASASRSERSDGAKARGLLLRVALRLFSEKGFAKTSTREIAHAAGANLAAIRYYFGDKAGLYRATFDQPFSRPRDWIAGYSDVALPPKEALARYFHSHLDPLKQGALVQQCLRLHMREMLEPTGQWADEVKPDQRQPHLALVALLVRQLALRRADDDVHRLAFSIGAMAMHLFICRDAIDSVRPALVKTPQAIDRWSERLTGYALALIEAERARRAGTSPEKTLA